MDPRFFKPKFTPIAAAAMAPAAAAQVEQARREAVDADAAFEAALREANLQLPIKLATRDLKGKLDEDLGSALRVAIERLWGRAMQTPDEVDGRLSIYRLEGDDGDTYYLDETPILWGGPIKLERVGEEMRAERALRILVRATVLR